MMLMHRVRPFHRGWSFARAMLASAGMAMCSAHALAAQSAQPYGIQAAVLFTSIRGTAEDIPGVGFEPQFRANRLYSTEGFGALSLGIGGQYSSHSKRNDDLQILGLFLEPRYVPPFNSKTVFPYLSARLALLRLKGDFQLAPSGSSNGSGFGAGGGVAIKLTTTTNLDAGVQLVRQQFGSIGAVKFNPFTTYTAKIGISLGFPR